jgi:hypothetical protein
VTPWLPPGPGLGKPTGSISVLANGDILLYPSHSPYTRELTSLLIFNGHKSRESPSLSPQVLQVRTAVIHLFATRQEDLQVVVPRCITRGYFNGDTQTNGVFQHHLLHGNALALRNVTIVSIGLRSSSFVLHASRLPRFGLVLNMFLAITLRVFGRF